MGKNKSNNKVVGLLSLVAIGMFGFGFALVPLYNLICDTFGLNGKFTEIEQGTVDVAQQAKRAEKIQKRQDLSRKVTVEFFSSLNQNLQWEFRPMTRKIKLHPGEVKTVKYYAKNKTGREVVAQAIPSISPGPANKYFTKMECFCFSQQTFKPGEEKEMPLIFVVDPDLPKNISTISLAYTFFDTENRSATNGQVNKYAQIKQQIQVKVN
ncbi:MAG: cytochrome c oxidase assembly protein [Thioalkalispiraceae bacterium]|jgi:cytochrome c oxidase assembly protein subunit 11